MNDDQEQALAWARAELERKRELLRAEYGDPAEAFRQLIVTNFDEAAMMRVWAEMFGDCDEPEGSEEVGP